jgi:hypothetical protein
MNDVGALSRLIASAFVLVLALGLAAPVANGASFAPEGVDLIGPRACCCPEQAHDDDAPPQLEAACCCDLRAPDHGLSLEHADAVLGDERPSPAAAAIATAEARPRAPSLRPSVQLAQARGPPPAASLFAQHTSLLL